MCGATELRKIKRERTDLTASDTILEWTLGPKFSEVTRPAASYVGIVAKTVLTELVRK